MYADGVNFFIYRFSAMAMNGIILDDANDQKGSKLNATMSLVLDFNHF